MTKKAKLLQQMQNNPRADWTIEQLKTLAAQYGLRWRQPGTSHVTFAASDGTMLTVPSHKPIKPVYIRQFLLLVTEHGALQ